MGFPRLIKGLHRAGAHTHRHTHTLKIFRFKGSIEEKDKPSFLALPLRL